MNELASRETKHGDIEGVRLFCECGADKTLIPVDWDTRDWAKVVCPVCFREVWIEVYS